MTNAPVIFSGHNDRAVVALCRFLTAVGRPFFVVASHMTDAILRTEWRKHVLFQRTSPELNPQLMATVATQVRKKGFTPALCPTSEFLNRFVLDHKDAMQEQGWHWVMPQVDVYLDLSDKSRSPTLIQKLNGLSPPRIQPMGQWAAPCVLKPNTNVSDGHVLYPRLCPTPAELQQAMTETHPQDWFSQEWVEGQSLYLCAFLDRFGCWSAFWQENLLQQAGGKSMVLARTCSNPGVDISALMRGLSVMGYHGPFMMELIRDEKQQLHFIEVNPRFWGPLDLARRACPELLHRFLADIDGHELAQQESHTTSDSYYAWAFGARSTACRTYPAAASLDSNDLSRLLNDNDIYAHADTAALFNQH